jgi:hypothetical protein
MHKYKALLQLSKGDVVCYTGLDGKYREITYIKTEGFVHCIKGRGYTPCMFFDWKGRKFQIPLEAWLYTRMKYEVKEPKDEA